MTVGIPPTKEEIFEAADLLDAALVKARARIVELEANQIPGRCLECASSAMFPGLEQGPYRFCKLQPWQKDRYNREHPVGVEDSDYCSDFEKKK